MFPQSGEGGDLAQSLPIGLPGRRMHQLPNTDRGRPAPALQSRLREIVEEDLRPVSREQRVGHYDMAVQGPIGREGYQDAGNSRFLRAELARVRRLVELSDPPCVLSTTKLEIVRNGISLRSSRSLLPSISILIMVQRVEKFAAPRTRLREHEFASTRERVSISFSVTFIYR